MLARRVSVRAKCLVTRVGYDVVLSVSPPGSATARTGVMCCRRPDGRGSERERGNEDSNCPAHREYSKIPGCY